MYDFPWPGDRNKSIWCLLKQYLLELNLAKYFNVTTCVNFSDMDPFAGKCILCLLLSKMVKILQLDVQQ